MSLISEAPVELAHQLEPVGADLDSVRAMMGRYPSGVAALCANVDGEPVGMVASSFTVGVSYDPPLVMFSVQRSSSTWPRLIRSPRIGISVLGDGQADACMRLASRSGDRFAGLDVAESFDGSIFLNGSPMWFDCSVESTTPAGDHEIVLLRVHAMAEAADSSPLVYHGRRFHSLSAL
ncbi:flavin reductase family protein [Microbacterium indicum]|uniref:flavin reductase family protein n=1 Tax=Microbacterium indicum TaxID=358100 RepID=UPI0004095B7E|nr:flavin reductase family protein [Microbacterium indicum]